MNIIDRLINVRKSGTMAPSIFIDDSSLPWEFGIDEGIASRNFYGPDKDVLEMEAAVLQPKPDLNFRKYEDNSVSTMTIICITNTHFDIKKMFDNFPITPYIVKTKRRGRRKNVPDVDPNAGIADGSIITMKYDNKIAGVNLNKKKTSFRNSITVVMIACGKKVNIKIPINGKIQMTGVKDVKQVEIVLKYLWKYSDYGRGDIMSFDSETLTDDTPQSMQVIVVPWMRNIDFSLGFSVDRDKLATVISNLPGENYRNLLDPSMGYTGVNIKFKLEKDIKTIECDTIKIFNGGEVEGEGEPEIIAELGKKNYGEYLATIDPVQLEKKTKKVRYNTFLVFHSGSVIMSGMNEEFMRDAYNDFLKIIDKYYNYIKETLR